MDWTWIGLDWKGRLCPRRQIERMDDNFDLCRKKCSKCATRCKKHQAMPWNQLGWAIGVQLTSKKARDHGDKGVLRARNTFMCIDFLYIQSIKIFVKFCFHFICYVYLFLFAARCRWTSCVLCPVSPLLSMAYTVGVVGDGLIKFAASFSRLVLLPL